MTSRKHPLSFPFTVRSVQLDVHKLIHVPHHHHIAVQLDNSVIFLERKRRELAPAVIEARVVGEIFMNGGKEIIDSLLGDPTNFKGVVTFWGKCVGIEGNERVFGGMLFERVIKSEKAGKISCVCYKSCPYFRVSAFGSRLLGCQSYLFLSPRLE